MLTRLIKILAIVVGATAAFPAASKAQVVVHGTYYEEVKYLTCPSTGQCVLVFSAVPQDTLITKLNCIIINETSNAFMYAFQMDVVDAPTSQNYRRPEFLPIPTPIAANSGQNYTIQASSNFLFGSGKYPAVLASNTGSGDVFMNCKINGTLQ